MLGVSFVPVSFSGFLFPSAPLPFPPFPSPLPARGFGERCELPSRVWAKPQPLNNLVHIWAKKNGSNGSKYTFEWKCEAFHIFILLYQTVILSTLIGWRLFVLINDMLCYVMNTGAAYRCRHGCYWTDWTILDAFQFCNFILRKKRFNLGSRYTASVTYSDLDLDDNRQSPMDTTAMKWTCTTDKTKFLKKVSNSSNMLCQSFAAEAAKELATL